MGYEIPEAEVVKRAMDELPEGDPAQARMDDIAAQRAEARERVQVNCPEGSAVIEGEDNVRAFHRLQMIHSLALEINTGINMRPVRSLIEHARHCGYLGEHHGGIKTKKSALRAMVRDYKEKVDPSYEPNERIVKAIGDAK